jgi:hypothetical protein
VIEAEGPARFREELPPVFLLADGHSVLHITARMDVAYVAQTESCVFLLDGDGFCRAAIPAAEADDAARKAALRCMDAQYVASLDVDVDGVLVSDPKPGRQMLFAKVSPKGKVALIRTAMLLEMRSLDGPMPVIQPAPVLDAIDLSEDPDDADDDKKLTSENPVATDSADKEPAKEDDDCMELTAPFSRELVRPAASRRELAPLADDGPDDLTRDDFTKIVDMRDRDSDLTIERIEGVKDAEAEAKALIEEIDAHVEPERDPGDIVVKQSVVQQIVAKSLAPSDRDSAPVTVAAPRTVRGFPPPPPIPISSRRGILPRPKRA